MKIVFLCCCHLCVCVRIINNMKRNETKCTAECEWEWNFAYGWQTGWNCVCVQCALVHVRVQCVCDLTTNTCTLLYPFFSSFLPLSRHFSQSLTNKTAATRTRTTKKQSSSITSIHSTRNRSKRQERVFALLHMVHVLKLARLRLIVSCVVVFSDMLFGLFCFYLLQQFFFSCFVKCVLSVMSFLWMSPLFSAVLFFVQILWIITMWANDFDFSKQTSSQQTEGKNTLVHTGTDMLNQKKAQRTFEGSAYVTRALVFSLLNFKRWMCININCSSSEELENHNI